MKENIKPYPVMILSAGFGERMRPLTEFIPKPVLPICGKPLLLSIIEKLSAAGAAKFAVNLHYEPKKILRALKKYNNDEFSEKISFMYEKEILGTGGGILNCKDILMRGDFFVLHNGDIISDADIGKVISFALCNHFDAVLLLVNGEDNKIAVDKDGRITEIVSGGRSCENRKLYTYAGIAVFKRSAFDYFSVGLKKFPLIDVFRKMIEAGKLGGIADDKIFWRDIGSVEKYFSVHEDILLKRLFKPSWLNENDIAIPQELRRQYPNELKGFISASDACEIRRGATAENCIILDNGVLKRGQKYRNEIIGENFSIHRDIRAILQTGIIDSCDFRKLRISSLPEQGSSRKFYRIAEGKNSKVLMLSSCEDQDFSRFIKIGKYLKSKDLNVPEIYNYSEEKYFVEMEDLGDLTLCEAYNNETDPGKRYKLLTDAISFLILFQLRTYKDAARVVKREFDFEGLRWESRYFAENFLAKFAGLLESELKELDEEFDEIAQNAMLCPQLLCHRDFQSKNIIIKDKKIYVVDFQGARIGPMGYDLMSLLRDAYIHVPEELFLKGICYYLCFMHFFSKYEGTEIEFEEEEFLKIISVSALQRNMQALGAFTFLGLEKGKKFYLDYIPRGLENLRNSLRVYTVAFGEGSLPKLNALTDRLMKV